MFAVALLGGGIYLIVTGHLTGGYALAGASVLAGIVVMALVLAAVVRLRDVGYEYEEGELAEFMRSIARVYQKSPAIFDIIHVI